MCLRFLGFFLLMTISASLPGQSKIFGPKGGMSMTFQSWLGTRSQPLFNPHGALYMEGYREGASTALFAQVGYHTRGSSERIFVNLGSSSFVEDLNVRFNNISALFGAKKRIKEGSGAIPYYSFGVRVEHTIGNNFEDFIDFAGYLPVETFINKWNYGATLAFGYEFPFSEFVGGLIEASVSPDLSFQYNQEQDISFSSPVSGQSVTLRRQKVRNVTFELTFGFRFLHKVIYLDE